MRYYGDVYRPPSEAYSLILQVTIGCSHNQCTFCRMYKEVDFRIKSLDEIREDLDDVPDYMNHPSRIFLADGDALIIKQEDLEEILKMIKIRFPECNRVGIYGSPKAIFTKSVDELKRLKDLGLGIVYLGVESGSDKVLRMVHKGVNHEKMVAAGKRIKDSGLQLSTTLISGLGGREFMEDHAIESARIMNEIQPDYIGLLSLMVDPITKLYEDVQNGSFQILNPKEILTETRLFLSKCELNNSIFRSNHASNYVPLKGVLNQDKDELIKKIDDNFDKIDEIAARKIQRF